MPLQTLPQIALTYLELAVADTAELAAVDYPAGSLDEPVVESLNQTAERAVVITGKLD